MRAEFVTNALAYLTVGELKILEARLDGYTYKYIGDKLGLQSSSVHSTIDRIKELFVEAPKINQRRLNAAKRSDETDAEIRYNLQLKINEHLSKIMDDTLPKYFGKDRKGRNITGRVEFATENEVVQELILNCETEKGEEKREVLKISIPDSSKNLNKAVYMDEMNPMTLQHLDIIKKASSIFDVLIVVVKRLPGESTDKHSERVALVTSECAIYSSVRVVGYERSVETFARVNKIQNIIRAFLFHTMRSGCLS